MNQIIIVSPLSDESALVEKLTERFPGTTVVEVGSLAEAKAVDGIAVLKHFSEGVGALPEILEIDSNVVLAVHSRDAIDDRINKMIAGETTDEDPDAISNLSAKAWRLHHIYQANKVRENRGTGKENVTFIETGFDSIYPYLFQDSKFSDNITPSTNPGTPPTTSEDAAASSDNPAEEVHDSVSEEQTDSTEQSTAEEPEPSPEVSQAAEVPTAAEPEPVAKVEQPKAEAEAPQPTPIDPSEYPEDYSPFDLTAAFNAGVEKSKESEVPEETKAEDPNLTKYRAGIPVDYPDTPHTVNVQKSPTEPKEGGTNPALAFNDWAGDISTVDGLIEGITEKMRIAESRGRTPRLTEIEEAALTTQADMIGAKMMHEFQYVANANWSQTIQTQTKAMPLIVPIKNPKYGDSKYVGDDAVALIQNRMKIGASVGVFLPHTGIYFIIVSPSDGELLNTLSVINTQRVETLRASSGILMGNSNYYINRQVVKLFLDSITDCSLTAHNRELLNKLIDERDINIIATALMAAIYPDGYDYVQTCGLKKEHDADEAEEICGHRNELLLNLMRTIFIDNSRLNEYQRTLAVSGIHKRSLQEIENYKEQNYLGYRKSYEITEGIEFVYRAQSIETSIEAGEKWIGEISQIVDSIITFKSDDEERNAMIDHRIGLARIREFSHWVDSITIDGQVMDDRNKINQLLDSLSRNDKVMKRVSDTLGEFQRLSTIAITAIPRVKCPSCQKTDPRDLDICQHLIPQDAVSRFFTLVRQRV